jgi:hypothetical protein
MKSRGRFSEYKSSCLRQSTIQPERANFRLAGGAPECGTAGLLRR